MLFRILRERSEQLAICDPSGFQIRMLSAYFDNTSVGLNSMTRHNLGQKVHSKMSKIAFQDMLSCPQHVLEGYFRLFGIVPKFYWESNV